MKRTLAGVIQDRPPDGRWRIKRSGVSGVPMDASTAAEVVTALRGAGIEVKEYWAGSPANVTSYHLNAQFEGGCLTASTGSYWYGEREAYIEGERALAFVAVVTGRNITTRMMEKLRSLDPAIDRYLVELKQRFRDAKGGSAEKAARGLV